MKKKMKVIMAVMLFGFVAACGGGSSGGGGTTSENLAPSVPEEPQVPEEPVVNLTPVVNIDPDVPLFVFGDAMSEEEKENFRNTAYKSMNYLKDEYGIILSRNLTYYVYVDRENFIEAYAEYHDASQADIDSWNQGIEEEANITGNEAWATFDGDGTFLFGKVFINDSRRLLHGVSHEHFHAIQTIGHLGNDRIGHAGPQWLIEGSARYVEALTLEYFGVPLDGLSGYYSKAAEVRAVSNLPASLESMATWEGFYRAEHDSLFSYILGRLAAEFLSDHYGGFEAIGEYYSTIASSEPFALDWKDVFEDTFGISVDQFNKEFAEYRSNGFE